jgi:transposase
MPWMSNFRPFDRETGFLLPPSLDDWLPERHLARFVVEVIGSLDLSAMARSYRGTGSASYHPELLLGVLVYGYTTGVFSSRKLERATYDSVAFRFISGNEHPDHDTIATFRRRFLKEIEGLFVRVLELAREMGLLKMGTVGLDGTKIHANASRHSALSYEHAGKIEVQLKAEVAELLARAEAADQAEAIDGMSIPDELARREQRLAKLAEARATAPPPETFHDGTRFPRRSHTRIFARPARRLRGLWRGSRSHLRQVARRARRRQATPFRSGGDATSRQARSTEDDGCPWGPARGRRSSGGEAMTEAKHPEAGRARFLLLPPLSAAEREAEHESERKLNVVLAEMFGPKGNYSDPEVEAACAVLNAREEANG